MRIERSVEINAPPEKIWPFLIEPEKIMKWFTLLKKFEYTGEQDGGVGTPFYYEEKSGPMLMKFIYVVKEWSENGKLAFRMTSGPARRDDHVWSIEAISSGSRVTLAEDYEMSGGIFGKMLMPLVGRMIGKHIEELAANMKILAEAQD